MAESENFEFAGERIDNERTLLKRVEYLTELMGEILNRVVDDDTAAENLLAKVGHRSPTAKVTGGESGKRTGTPRRN